MPLVRRSATLLVRLNFCSVLDNGQTALHYAAWHGNLAMVSALLAQNAPVNILKPTAAVHLPGRYMAL